MSRQKKKEGSNSFSALAAFDDADALSAEVAATLDRRRNGAETSGSHGDSSSGSGRGPFKQPLVWIDLEM